MAEDNAVGENNDRRVYQAVSGGYNLEVQQEADGSLFVRGICGLNADCILVRETDEGIGCYLGNTLTHASNDAGFKEQGLKSVDDYPLSGEEEGKFAKILRATKAALENSWVKDEKTEQAKALVEAARRHRRRKFRKAMELYKF